MRPRPGKRYTPQPTAPARRDRTLVAAMDAQSTPPPREPDDHTGLAWRDDAWLAAWPLTRATALDYLACSPFYDRNCNNERAKAQGLGPDDLACVDSGFGRW